MGKLKRVMVRAAVGLALVTPIWALLAWGQADPQGPVPIVWDQEACAECRMHVGEPRFAAQLQTADGLVLNFDDPGCALRFIARTGPRVRALYFHHAKEETWLKHTQTAFVPSSPSPMGYDLAAIPKGSPGALSLQEATLRVTQAKAVAAP
jgi:hypothetical protein